MVLPLQHQSINEQIYKEFLKVANHLKEKIMEEQKKIEAQTSNENATPKVVTVEALQAQVDTLYEHIEKLTKRNENLQNEAEYYRKRMVLYMTKYDFMRVLAMVIGNETITKIVKDVDKKYDI